MTGTLETQTDSKVATEKDLAELESNIADKTAFKEQKETALEEQGKLKDSINTDCAWVATHFDTRREKRKTEIDGLVEAKFSWPVVETESMHCYEADVRLSRQ